MDDVVSAFRRAAEKGEVSELPPDVAAQVFADVQEKWMREPAHFWWWESFRSQPVVIEFHSGNEPSTILSGFIAKEALVYLAITDDKDPPWPIFFGERGGLDALREELRAFEYLLVAEDRRWIVFETHENQLWIAGYFLTFDALKPPR